MNLIQLRYFYESAQSESFSKTAEKYMVPTSTVSAAVKRLEREIGASLFDRSANKLSLNSSGHIFAEALGNAFFEVESAIEAVRASKSAKPEISLLVMVGRSFITDLLIEYKSGHPEIKFKMSHNSAATNFNSFDIIINEKNEAMNTKMEHFLFSVEKLCIKGSKDDPLAGKTITMRQISNRPFIMMNNSGNMRRVLVQSCERNGFVPDIAFECEERHCLLKSVESGMGLTVGSVRALNEDIQSRLISLNVSDFNEKEEIYVYHHRLNAVSPAVRDFISFLSEQSEQLFHSNAL